MAYKSPQLHIRINGLISCILPGALLIRVEPSYTPELQFRGPEETRKLQFISSSKIIHLNKKCLALSHSLPYTYIDNLIVILATVFQKQNKKNKNSVNTFYPKLASQCWVSLCISGMQLNS